MKLRKLGQAVMRRLGYDIRWIPRVLADRPEARYLPSLDAAIARRFVDAEDFFFVQVGAFDGICVDPLARMRDKLQLRGLMIEPQPDAFARLTENMKGRPGLELLQLAVSDQTGEVPFYAVDPAAPHLPSKFQLISSLSREALLRELDPAVDWSPWVRRTIVPCVTLNTLFEQRKVARVDLLQIDAEGYDGRILRALDFNRWSPAIINFEHVLLPPVEAEACWRALVDGGYALYVSPPDTLAVHRSMM